MVPPPSRVRRALHDNENTDPWFLAPSEAPWEPRKAKGPRAKGPKAKGSEAKGLKGHTEISQPRAQPSRPYVHTSVESSAIEDKTQTALNTRESCP